MSIGLIAVLAALALTDSLLTVNRSGASQIYMNEAASAAEDGIQYAVASLNNAAASGSLQSFPGALQVPSAMTNGISVAVTITSLDPPPLAFTKSPVYDPLFTSANNSGMPVPLNPDYRQVTSIAQNIFCKRAVSVIVGPNPYSVTSPSPPIPFFQSALEANQTLTIQGVNVMQEGSSANLANNLISSNQQVNISGNVEINGSVNAFTSSSPNSLVYSNTGPTALVVDGNVNSIFPGNSPPSYLVADVPGASSPNVLGDGQVGVAPGSVTSNPTSSVTAPGLTAVPTQAAQEVELGQNSIGVATPSTVNGAGGVGNLGSVNLSSSGTQSMTIEPGQFAASSLNMTAGSTLNLSDAGTGGQPVQLYIQGQGAGASPISISGSVSGISSASNFQIFYNGSESITITSPNFYGMIYAPNANVTVDTSLGAFHGAVVANNLTLQGGKFPFYFDPNSILTSPSAGKVASGPGYNPNSTTKSFRLLSWQEFVPLQ